MCWSSPPGTSTCTPAEPEGWQPFKQAGPAEALCDALLGDRPTTTAATCLRSAPRSAPPPPAAPRARPPGPPPRPQPQGEQSGHHGDPDEDGSDEVERVEDSAQ